MENNNQNAITQIKDLLNQLNNHMLNVNNNLFQMNTKIIQINDIMAKNNMLNQRNNSNKDYLINMMNSFYFYDDLINKKNEQEIKKEEKLNKEELNEEGLDKEAIETVMNEGKCSKEEAIKALRKHNGDPVEALLEIDCKNEEENNSQDNNFEEGRELLIENVVKEGMCSREDAIEALLNHNWDPVEALIEVGKNEKFV